MEATMKKFVPPTKDETDKMMSKWRMGRMGKNPDGSPKRRSSSDGTNIEDD
jgi:hypothetical protein